MLIAIEGVDGVGKTTLARGLKDKIGALYAVGEGQRPEELVAAVADACAERLRQIAERS